MEIMLSIHTGGDLKKLFLNFKRGGGGGTELYISLAVASYSIEVIPLICIFTR